MTDSFLSFCDLLLQAFAGFWRTLLGLDELEKPKWWGPVGMALLIIACYGFGWLWSSFHSKHWSPGWDLTRLCWATGVAAIFYFLIILRITYDFEHDPENEVE